VVGFHVASVHSILDLVDISTVSYIQQRITSANSVTTLSSYNLAKLSFGTMAAINLDKHLIGPATIISLIRTYILV
jgi:hypothetical protein